MTRTVASASSLRRPISRPGGGRHRRIERARRATLPRSGSRRRHGHRTRPQRRSDSRPCQHSCRATSPASHMVVCDVTDTELLCATLARCRRDARRDRSAHQQRGARSRCAIGGHHRRRFPHDLRRELLRPRCRHVGRAPLHACPRLGDDRQRVVRRRSTPFAGSGRLPVVKGGALGVQRVDVVPARATRHHTSTWCTPPSWPPSSAWAHCAGVCAGRPG